MPLSSVLGAQSLVRPGVCTSSTRPASPFEGQVIYETDTDLVQVYNGSGWKALGRMVPSTNGAVLQVIQGTTTTAASNSTTTYADTNLSATITPTSTSSKVLVMVTQTGVVKSSINAGNLVDLRLMRDSTEIQVFGADVLFTNTTLFLTSTISTNYLDSPNTTSAVTYKTQFRNGVAAAAAEVQSTSVGPTPTSTMLLLEIAG